MNVLAKSFLILYLSLIFAPIGYAKHDHHSSYGTHGMALVSMGEHLIASHMPLHNSMHEHQIIFTTKVDQSLHKKLINLIKNNQLISLLPERFELKNLQKGELKGFKATVFKGHFERGGKPKLENIYFTVNKVIFDNKLTASKAANKSNRGNGHYKLVKLADNDWLAIHKIKQKPSFDHLAWIKSDSNSLSDTTVSSDGKTLSKSNVQSGIKFHQHLYLETLDFQ